MKSIGPAPQSAQLVLSIVLFVPVTFLLIAYPSFHGAGALGALALLVCVTCLTVMGLVAYSMKDNLRLQFASCGLFLFAVFFGVERVIGHVARWPPLRWVGERPWLVAVLGAGAALVSCVVWLPNLRGIKDSRSNLQMEHDKFIAAAESSLDDFYIFDGIPDETGKIVDFRFSYLNRNSERRLDRTRETLIGQVLTEARPFMMTSGLIEVYRDVVQTGVPFTGEVFIDDEMIKETWLNVQVVKLGDGLAITSRDITANKRMTARIQRLAHYDQLTGLPNRTLLLDRLGTAILRAKRNSQKVAVFMLDIDGFKNINDTMGHADGDALLVAVGKRLLSAVRESDTVGRMGGDEFVIVMADFQCLEDVMKCGQQIVEKAARPISIGGREIRVTVSVGLCIYPDNGAEAEHLLKNADAAMYAVKNSGRNGLHLFAESS